VARDDLEPDPADALPRAIVGDWVREKHERLKAYTEICREVRRKFNTKAGATYIELFSGPGRARIRNTQQVIDGSAVIACRTAQAGGAPFSEFFVADFDPSLSSAAAKRLKALGAKVECFSGEAVDSVHTIVEGLRPSALHFAFLDPYSLGALPFEIIARLSTLDRMDILIHISAQDLQRNLRRYTRIEGGVLDTFAPGWRDKVHLAQPDAAVRSGIFQHWMSLIRSLDMSPSEGVELVAGGRRQPLYWLVLAARHSLAGKFWEKIRNIHPQRGFDF
jgi:three-Cys-motif partner protein